MFSWLKGLWKFLAGCLGGPEGLSYEEEIRRQGEEEKSHAGLRAEAQRRLKEAEKQAAPPAVRQFPNLWDLPKNSPARRLRLAAEQYYLGADCRAPEEVLLTPDFAAVLRDELRQYGYLAGDGELSDSCLGLLVPSAASLVRPPPGWQGDLHRAEQHLRKVEKFISPPKLRIVTTVRPQGGAYVPTPAGEDEAWFEEFLFLPLLLFGEKPRDLYERLPGVVEHPAVLSLEALNEARNDNRPYRTYPDGMIRFD